MDVSEEEFFKTLAELNEDNTVHGILMFRPLPKHIDGEKARQMLLAAKDVDGCTDGSLAGVFTNTKVGFAPCTAEAAMKILEFYDIDLTGKNVAVVGRSLVVTEEYVSDGQIIIDVGIGWNEEKQKLCGDVLFESVEPKASGITPVPGGVGAVTTSVLVSHVVEAAKVSEK